MKKNFLFLLTFFMLLSAGLNVFSMHPGSLVVEEEGEFTDSSGHQRLSATPERRVEDVVPMYHDFELPDYDGERVERSVVEMLRSCPDSVVLNSEDIRVVNDYVDDGCLVVFDVDYTIACPQAELMSDSVVRVMFDQLLPVDGASDLIASLQARKIPVIAHTNRPSAMSRVVREQLKRMDIDFLADSIYGEDVSISSDQSSDFVYGMIFGNLNDKGETFGFFLKRTGLIYKKIIFVDDSFKNVKSMGAAVRRLGMEFVGIRFSKFDKCKPYFS